MDPTITDDRMQKPIPGHGCPTAGHLQEDHLFHIHQADCDPAQKYAAKQNA